jgi:hypothetical protein
MDYDLADYATYAFPSPNYLLLVVGLFMVVTSGFAFQETLKFMVRDWFQNNLQVPLPRVRSSLNLRLPYIGMLLGTVLFLGSGIEVFGFSAKAAYVFSLPLTVVTGILVWWQLGKILGQLEEGGSAAIDLDALF